MRNPFVWAGALLVTWIIGHFAITFIDAKIAAATVRETLQGLDKIQNEQAMRQYPTAGITPDMSAEEREKRSFDAMQRQNAELMKKNEEFYKRLGSGEDPNKVYSDTFGNSSR